MLLVQLAGYTQYLSGGKVSEKNAPFRWRFIVLMMSRALAVAHTHTGEIVVLALKSGS